MKKILYLFLITMLILTGCTQEKKADAKIEKITIQSSRNTNIYATITLPSQKEMSLVVMAHGFIGDREGCANFEPLSKQLTNNGIASICIDFTRKW